MAKTIRELLVKIGIKADTTTLNRFDKGLTRVKSGMRQASALALGLAGAVVTVSSVVVKAAVDTAHLADEHAKAAKRVGVTAEEMQELAYAAQISGAEMTDVETGLRRLAANAADAAAGTGEATESFKALGVAVTDANGEQRGQLELLTDIAGKMAGIDNEARKVALAQDIFGRSGAKLLPLLNEGAGGIDRLRARARELGLVIGNEAAAESEAFVDALTDAKSVLTGLRNQIGIAVIPTLRELTERFTAWFQRNRDFIKLRVERVVRQISAGFVLLADMIEAADDWVQKIGGWPVIFGAVGGAITLMFGVRAVAAIGSMASGLWTLFGAVSALSTALGVGLGTTLLIVIAAIASVGAAVGIAAAEIGAILLLVEDFVAFFQGKDSFTRDFVNQFVDADEFLRVFWGTIDSGIRFLDAFAAAARRVGNDIYEALLPAIREIRKAMGPLEKVWRAFWGPLITNSMERLKELTALLDRAAAALNSFAVTGNYGDLAPGADIQQRFVQALLPSGPPAGSSSRSVQFGDVNIHGVEGGALARQSEARRILHEQLQVAHASLAAGER